MVDGEGGRMNELEQEIEDTRQFRNFFFCLIVFAFGGLVFSMFYYVLMEEALLASDSLFILILSLLITIVIMIIIEIWVVFDLNKLEKQDEKQKTDSKKRG